MAKEKLECSFCGRKNQTPIIDCWNDAHICDKCIEQAHGIVLEELKSTEVQNYWGSYFKRNQN
jgi:ATP-dependent Clp protease ATP-binding subunit ClpX